MTDSDDVVISKEEAELAYLIAKTRLTAAQADEAEDMLRWKSIQYGRREYTISDGIDAVEAYKYRTLLTGWLDFNPETEITVWINSGGGIVFDGLGIYDWTKEQTDRGAKITTRVYGWAGSMAGILLQMGSRRLITPNGHIMIHEAKSLIQSSMTASQMKQQEKFLTSLQERCLNILAERSTLSTDEIATKSEHINWYVNADEAVELGFVDDIVR